MNLRRLQAFRAVFETGSVTRAAQQLHSTQPAVSRLIRELEAELALRLFVRQSGRLIPSAEGRSFHREAERALAAVETIVDIARDLRTLKGMHLRVVAPMLTAFGILPAAISDFRQRYPQARVSLEIKDLRDIAEWVATGPFDIGVTALPFDDPRVQAETLARIPQVVVLPHKHTLTRKAFVKLRDLAGESIILPSGNPPRAVIMEALNAASVRYTSTIDTSSALSVCQLVALGLGVGVVDPFTAELAKPLGVVSRPLLPTVAYAFGCFFPAHRPRSTMVNAFVAAVRTAIADGAPPSRSEMRTGALMRRPPSRH